LRDGDLYQRALAQVDAALSTGGEILGLLWHQGENDAGQFDLAGSYGERFAQAATAWRKDLALPHLPIVCGTLAAFIANSQAPRHWQTVNHQINTLPSRLEHCAVVSGEDLWHHGDGIHLDGPSVKTLGQRYGAALLDLLQAR
jgi:hypothetical protein